MTFAEGISRRDGALYCADVALSTIAADVGTPTFVYNLDAVRARYREHVAAFAGLRHRVCYAVKANGSLALLHALAGEGCGFDANSAGELARCLRAGADPALITMTGVGKSRRDIEAAFDAGVLRFNIESASECRMISDIAERRGVCAEVLLRLNPDVETDTHPYISTGEAAHKFGLGAADIHALASQAAWLPGLRIAGISFHLGSQILAAEPYVQALQLLLHVFDSITPLLADAPTVIDIGGGFGVAYEEDQTAFPLPLLAQALREVLGDRASSVEVITEPGRSIVANAGVLLSTVEHIKPSPSGTFLIIDAGMNDLLRPALYGALHRIVPLREYEYDEQLTYEVVGPVCETGDTFARRYPLPIAVEQGDVVAVLSAGAYASSMSSTYNSRPLAAEVVVSGNRWTISRERQSIESMLQLERIPDGM